jgi:hypothetical protein
MFLQGTVCCQQCVQMSCFCCNVAAPMAEMCCC